MVGAEALKGIDAIHDKLQDIDERMTRKGITEKGINSAQITGHLHLFMNHVFMVRYRERTKSDSGDRTRGSSTG